MATYKTPGVYVKEESTLPPSVAEVSTAIPAFIGYTEEKSNGKDHPVVERINTLLEYETLFGLPQPSEFAVSTGIDQDTGLPEYVKLERVEGKSPKKVAKPEDPPEFLMYYSLSHYFKNGGGTCYVVSVGNYDSGLKKADFVDGLSALEKEDEPTLILLTDAINLPTKTEYYSLIQDALQQCKELGDRFTILDVLGGDTDKSAAQFRGGIGRQNLQYGAAYQPYLQTSMNYRYEENGIKTRLWEVSIGERQNGIIVRYADRTRSDTVPSVKFESKDVKSKDVKSKDVKSKDKVESSDNPISFEIKDRLLTITSPAGTGYDAILSEWEKKSHASKKHFWLGTEGVYRKNPDPDETQPIKLEERTIQSLKTRNTAFYNQIKTALAQQQVVLPPSPSIAGVYASVDRERGVWKSPANVSLASVIGPVTKITRTEQDDLNVDPTGGKSINAIRAFTGKGTLVWGARTLAGNDNEWRYISVRRLFNMIEESTQKATAFAVFEPNDATTWLKVKAMIESYLYGLWEQGALAGPTPESAYFVNVGLGKTMTPQDVLEGRMIVEIGVAAVRPAEFIILQFMHKLQEA